MIDDPDAQASLIVAPPVVGDVIHDDVTREVRTYDEAGALINTRPYGAYENMVADREAVAAAREAELDVLEEQLRSGLAAVIQAREMARDDVVRAAALRDDAQALQAAASAQKAQVDAFVPGATYRAADLTAIRGALSAIIARQALILDGLAGMSGWRKAVDENAIITDNSLIWLAKRVTEDLEALEA